jgi:hypothetical protein
LLSAAPPASPVSRFCQRRQSSLSTLAQFASLPLNCAGKSVALAPTKSPQFAASVSSMR